jgi:hypothetical protein
VKKKRFDKKLIDIIQEAYLRGTLDGAENFASKPWVGRFVAEKGPVINPFEFEDVDTDEKLERIFDQLLKMNEIIAGINRGPKTVEDLEAETTDNPEAEKPGELNSFCRLVSTWWEDIEEKLKEQREAKEKESKKPEEEKRCGNCRFRNNKGECRSIKLVHRYPDDDPNAWTNNAKDEWIVYQGEGLWVGKRFGCIFWEKKSVEERIITCHFCGSVNQKLDVELPEFNFSSVFVRCLNCGARGPRKLSVPEAITAWNRIGKIEDYEE